MTSPYQPAIPADLPPGPRPMIAAVRARKGSADQLRTAVAELAAAVRREPGCLTFIPYEEAGTPGHFQLYEVYTGTDAFRAHLDTPHVHRFFEALAAYSTTTAKDLTQLTEVPVPRD